MCAEYKGIKHYFTRRRRSEQVFLILSWIMKFNFFALLARGIYLGDTILIIKSIESLLIVFLPFMLEKSKGIVTPAFLDFLITAAMLFHQRGMAFGLYDLFGMYDVIAHSFTSLVLSTLLIVFFYLWERNSSTFKAGPGFIVLLGIVFTMAFGVVWEIGEFTLDQLFGYHTQPDLVDTMQDLILDTAAALLIAILSYIAMKRGSFERAVLGTDESLKELISESANK